MQKPQSHHVLVTTANSSFEFTLGDSESYEYAKDAHGIETHTPPNEDSVTFIRMKDYRNNENQNSLAAVVDAIKELSDITKAANGYKIPVPKTCRCNAGEIIHQERVERRASGLSKPE